MLITVYGSWAMLRPLPLLQPSPATKEFAVTAPSSKLTWPVIGQSAVAIAGESVFETHGSQSAAPIASTAKVITALTVLDKKPLKNGEQGPTVTITEADVVAYYAQTANDGSVLPVVVGETLSEYQMLQALMLPSANNIADKLAYWAFGSQAAYNTAATAYVSKHDMTNTTIGEDASGLSPTTTSTAADLAKLGVLAMKNPVLSEIVAQPSATGIPQTTSIKNVNSLLGTSNIVGVKTGNTEQAGGVFISASKIAINDRPKTIVTAVVGSPNLFSALSDSLALVRSAQSNFSPVEIIRKGDIVGRYHQPWGDSLAAVSDKTVTDTVWNGSKASATVRLKPFSVTDKSVRSVGYIQKNSSSIVSNDIRLSRGSTEPSLIWRLTHPF